MDPRHERMAFNLANDLVYRNEQAATDILRELAYDPEAFRVMDKANRMADSMSGGRFHEYAIQAPNYDLQLVDGHRIVADIQTQPPPRADYVPRENHGRARVVIPLPGHGVLGLNVPLP